MFHRAMLFTAVILAACGGSDNTSPPENQALRAQANVWENRMPRAEIPGMVEQPCTSLIVSFSLRAGTPGFPPGITAQSVTLSKPGVPMWQTPVSNTETGLTTRWVNDSDWISNVGSLDGTPPPGRRSEQVLYGVARGCSTPNFQPGDELLVGVRVAVAGQDSVVLYRAKLTAAY